MTFKKKLKIPLIGCGAEKVRVFAGILSGWLMVVIVVLVIVVVVIVVLMIVGMIVVVVAAAVVEKFKIDSNVDMVLCHLPTMLSCSN